MKDDGKQPTTRSALEAALEARDRARRTAERALEVVAAAEREVLRLTNTSSPSATTRETLVSMPAAEPELTDRALMRALRLRKVDEDGFAHVRSLHRSFRRERAFFESRTPRGAYDRWLLRVVQKTAKCRKTLADCSDVLERGPEDIVTVGWPVEIRNGLINTGLDLQRLQTFLRTYGFLDPQKDHPEALAKRKRKEHLHELGRGLEGLLLTFGWEDHWHAVMRLIVGREPTNILAYRPREGTVRLAPPFPRDAQERHQWLHDRASAKKLGITEVHVLSKPALTNP